MTKKKTIRFKMDEALEIDIQQFDFEGNETEEEICKRLTDWYFDQCGYEGITVNLANQKITLTKMVKDIIDSQ